MSADDIENHVRACGMDMKKYKKIETVVSKILDKGDPSVDTLLTLFAKKCYGNFPKEDGKKQAGKFLKVLFNDLDILVRDGPSSAIEQASEGMKGKKKVMRIVRLNKPIDGFTKKLDCYLVGETIGKGATSVVKLGRKEGPEKKEVAIKILTVDGNSFKLSELEKEIQVLKELNHKNVIRMYECFHNVQYPGYTDNPTIVMVLELATKGELFDFFMHTGNFALPLARWFFKQLIEGMEYCHSKKIAHRDLKPENLLMGDGFNVKLVDFGFARFFVDEKGKDVKMKTALGTPGYAAPEILKHQKYDDSVDIFSLGVILFICIAGFPPFQEAKASDWWFDKIMKKKYDLFWKAHERCMKFSDDAKDILLGMLAAKPADRYGWKELRNHKWTNGPTCTQEEASQRLMQLKAEVDKQLLMSAAKGEAGKRRAVGDFVPPILTSFLPVNHMLTTYVGTQAVDIVQDFISKQMNGKVKKIITDLWVGPIPEEGIDDFEEDGESKGDDSSKKENEFEKGVKLKGYYWKDIEFTVNHTMNQREEKADKGEDDDFHGPKSTPVPVHGVVCVRRHPEMKAEDGNPLNVIYFKRRCRVLPLEWHSTVNYILAGVSHMMNGTITKYFKRTSDIKEKAVASSVLSSATSAVSSALCCSTGGAKKFAD